MHLVLEQAFQGYSTSFPSTITLGFIGVVFFFFPLNIKTLCILWCGAFFK